MRGFILVFLAGFVGAQAPRYDLVITNARIVDGTGSPWYYGDLAVTRDRIARITPRGMLAGAAAEQRVDGQGKLVLAPGFIDIQSHSREAFLTGDGRVISKVSQGFTTEILGEGASNAPASEKSATEADARFIGPHGFDRWLKAIQERGVSVNFGSYAGQGTIRAYAKGMAAGKATAEEIAEMQGAMKEAMEDGAFGLASALIYPPGSYSDTEELIAVAKVMAAYGGTYITHMRSEADDLFPAFEETVRIGKEAGVPVEIYHLKAAGKRNWGKAGELLTSIHNARKQGVDLQANMYPYTAGSTGLSACLPPWSAADGKLYENINNPEVREKMREEMLRERTSWENLCNASTPEGVLVLGVMKPENKQYAGKYLSEIAASMGVSWTEAVFRLLGSEKQRISTVYFMMSDSNVEAMMREPWMKFGTDAGGVDPENPRGLVHPRSYGTATRILGYYVREKKVLTLEEAVRKLTSATALRLQILDRGLLRPGFYADLVLFDADKVGSTASYTEPHQVSSGIHSVYVNGVAVWREGRHTGAKPGAIVRGPGYGRGANQAYDIVYKNARLIDGTGAGWYSGDLAVKSGRIAAMTPPGLLNGASARQSFDLKGLALSPGFIDIQSHSREALTRGDGRLVSKITQGITSEIMGEGWSNAPANEKTGDQADSNFTGPHSFDRWLRTMAGRGASANFGSFVGAGTIRAYGKGFAMGEPSAAELGQMTAALSEALGDGSFGLASALIYPPGSYASTAELTALARAMAPWGGTYISHIRSEADKLLESIEEAASIGRNGGVAAEIYHLKAAGRKNWQLMPAAIQRIQNLRDAGVDIQANMYPYEASGTALTAMLPDWSAADGKLWANLDNKEMREKIMAEMLRDNKGRDPDLVQPIGLKKPENQRFKGMRLNRIAEDMKLPWPETVIALLRSERQTVSTIYFTINESNIATQLKQPWIKISTDAGGADPEAKNGPTHPRTYGTYPRVLGYYSRELKAIPLEDAVFKMTGAVATRLHLQERGLLRPGMAADLVVFDPATVKDEATFEDPHRLSTGISQVVVNGEIVVLNGKHTGAKPGKILRGPGYRYESVTR
ncbi:MAG: N-acyl-D-amino-acid deacylase family protein [Acidobacteriota bacterium]